MEGSEEGGRGREGREEEGRGGRGVRREGGVRDGSEEERRGERGREGKVAGMTTHRKQQMEVCGCVRVGSVH